MSGQQGGQQQSQQVAAAAQQAAVLRIPGKTQDGIDYVIQHGPTFPILVMYLKQGQSVRAEKGAMMYMHRTIEMTTQRRDSSIWKSLKTAALGGESFFVNTFTAQHGHGEVSFVTAGLGDIMPIELYPNYPGYIVQKGSYVVNCHGVNLDTEWQGAKGFFAEGQMFMLHASGHGTMFIASFGAMITKDLQPGEVLSLDNGHLVALQDNMHYTIRAVGGLKSTMLSGEGLVIDITGPGRVIMQTRHLAGFAHTLVPFMPSNR
jgi:uncharacterized protein (TIGR00266 family)